MPITQDRMIALLNSAIDYQQAFDRSLEILREEFEKGQNGEITWEQAAWNMQILVSPTGLLARPIQSYSIIQVERAHWRSNARRNINAKNRQEQKRLERGGKRRKQRPPTAVDFVELPVARDTAPRSMSRGGRLIGNIDGFYQEEVVNGRATEVKVKARYRPDPSLAEDDEWEAPEAETEAKATPSATAEPKIILHNSATLAEIDRLAEAAVASHPGTVGEAEAEPTEVEPAPGVAKRREQSGEVED